MEEKRNPKKMHMYLHICAKRNTGRVNQKLVRLIPTEGGWESCGKNRGMGTRSGTGGGGENLAGYAFLYSSDFQTMVMCHISR